MSAGLDVVTVTPGSTAPVLSVTVPLIRPRKSCAEAGSTPKSSAARHRIEPVAFNLMDIPPESGPTPDSNRGRRSGRPAHTDYLPPPGVDPAQPI